MLNQVFNILPLMAKNELKQNVNGQEYDLDRIYNHMMNTRIRLDQYLNVFPKKKRDKRWTFK